VSTLTGEVWRSSQPRRRPTTYLVGIYPPNGALTPVSPEQPAPAIRTSPQTSKTLTMDRVVSNLQLLLALRRSRRNEDLACVSIQTTRAA
jgi:hypothetical protein